MKRKKGMVFSLIIAILITTFMGYYLVVNYYFDEKNRVVVGDISSETLMGIVDDFTDNCYIDALGIVSNLSDENSYKVLSLNLDISEDKNYTKAYQSYRNFISQNYKNFSNIDITFSYDKPDFYLEKYDYSFNISTPGTFYYYPLDQNKIESIKTIIRVNKSKDELSWNTTPSDSGSIPMKVKILDRNGVEILEDDALLDPDSSNSPFEVVFNDSSGLKVSFGKVGSNSGMGEYAAAKLNASIELLDIFFSPQNSSCLKTYDKLNLSLDGYSKQDSIYLDCS